MANPFELLHEDVWTGTAQAEEKLSGMLNDPKTRADETVSEKKKVAGFTIVGKRIENEWEKNARISRLQARRSELCNRLANMEQLGAILKSKEIDALAIVPEKIWDAVCQEGKLFRFEDVNSKNQVRCENFIETANVVFTATMLLQFIFIGLASYFNKTQPLWITVALIIAAFLTRWLIKNSQSYDEDECEMLSVASMLLSGAIAIFSPGACGFLLSLGIVVLDLIFILLSYWIIKDMPVVRKFAVGIIFLVLPRKVLYKKLWPMKKDVIVDMENSVKIEIALPTPPEDVARIISIAHAAKFKLCVAAVNEAIDINWRSYSDSAQELASKKKLEKKKAEEMARNRLKRDPIIYIKDEGRKLVAILAQFGDFPIEQEVMKKISVDFL